MGISCSRAAAITVQDETVVHQQVNTRQESLSKHTSVANLAVSLSLLHSGDCQELPQALDDQPRTEPTSLGNYVPGTLSSSNKQGDAQVVLCNSPTNVDTTGGDSTEDRHSTQSVALAGTTHAQQVVSSDTGTSVQAATISQPHVESRNSCTPQPSNESVAQAPDSQPVASPGSQPVSLVERKSPAETLRVPSPPSSPAMPLPPPKRFSSSCILTEKCLVSQTAAPQPAQIPSPELQPLATATETPGSASTIQPTVVSQSSTAPARETAQRKQPVQQAKPTATTEAVPPQVLQVTEPAVAAQEQQPQPSQPSLQPVTSPSKNPLPSLPLPETPPSKVSSPPSTTAGSPQQPLMPSQKHVSPPQKPSSPRKVSSPTRAENPPVSRLPGGKLKPLPYQTSTGQMQGSKHRKATRMNPSSLSPIKTSSSNSVLEHKSSKASRLSSSSSSTDVLPSQTSDLPTGSIASIPEDLPITSFSADTTEEYAPGMLTQAAVAAANILHAGRGAERERELAREREQQEGSLADVSTASLTNWSMELESDLLQSLPPPAYHRRTSSNVSCMSVARVEDLLEQSTDDLLRPGNLYITPEVAQSLERMLPSSKFNSVNASGCETPAPAPSLATRSAPITTGHNDELNSHSPMSGMTSQGSKNKRGGRHRKTASSVSQFPSLPTVPDSRTGSVAGLREYSLHELAAVAQVIAKQAEGASEEEVTGQAQQVAQQLQLEPQEAALMVNLAGKSFNLGGPARMDSNVETPKVSLRGTVTALA